VKFTPTHIVVLLVLVLLVFGSSKLPDIARSVGQSMKVFKKEVKELRDDDSKAEPTQSGQTAQSAEGSSQK